MSQNTKLITDASLNTDVPQAKGPVQVDFWAAWRWMSHWRTTCGAMRQS